MSGFDVKICGLTHEEDARVALAAGADYLGFVLYPPSPRGITVARLFDILQKLDEPFRAVAVVVNMSDSELAALTQSDRLEAVQFHGDETPAVAEGLSLPAWRAVRLRDGDCRPDPATWPAERYVIDAAVPGMYGGTGVTVDWEAAGSLARRHPVMLSGGLTVQNVGKAVETVRPRGVDVASGVEREPGRKDHEAVRRFVAEAREAARRMDLI